MAAVYVILLGVVVLWAAGFVLALALAKAAQLGDELAPQMPQTDTGASVPVEPKTKAVQKPQGPLPALWRTVETRDGAR
jgi:hypothetical protein